MARPHHWAAGRRGARGLLVLALMTLAAVLLTSSIANARTIRGTAKGDVLKGTAKADRIFAGAGNDRIRVSGGGADRVSCGKGRDRVVADSRDRVASNCEVVRRTGVLLTNFGDEAAVHGQHGPSTGHLVGSSANVDLLGKIKLTNAEGDISDVSALQSARDGKWYAYVGDWGAKCSTGGVYVVDISNPAAPTRVRFINSRGRGYITEGVQALRIQTTAYTGDILVLSNEWCAVKPNPKQNPGGITIWDINNPAEPKLLVEAFGDFDLHGPNQAAESHSVIAWDAGDKAFAAAIDNEELEDVDLFDITNPRRPAMVAETDLPGVHVNAYGTEKTSHDFDVLRFPNGTWHLMVSDWDAGWIDVDVTDPANPKIVGDFDYAPCDQVVRTACPPEGNAHQGEWNSDGSLFVGTDEDFSPFRLPITVTEKRTDGNNPAGQPAPGTLYAAGEFSWTKPVADRLDDKINGPTIFGGYGCPGNPVPPESALGTLRTDEESIIVFQRGPVQDPNAPIDSCFFSDKVAAGEAAGYDVVIIADHHVGSQAGHHPDSFLCGSQGSPVAGTAHGLCTGHRFMHEIFGYPADFTVPYPSPDTGDKEPDVGELGARISASSQYDGWGYSRLIDTRDPDPTTPAHPMVEVGQFAIDETGDPAFADGPRFGDLTVHEVEVPRNDPNEGGAPSTRDDTDKLAYYSWYSGGLRVVDITNPAAPREVGHYIDENGNNFWGVALAEDASGNRIILESDRDFGLFIFRYTGPMP
jgi:hypothetical protein